MSAEAKNEQKDTFDDAFMAKGDGKFDDDVFSGGGEESFGAHRLRTHTFSSRITLRHILSVHREATERSSARTNQTVLRSKAEARQILERLMPQVNPSNFADMARAHSDCESFDTGGDLGVIEPGDYAVEFDDAAYALQIGEMSGIIETDRGFHIIMRER
jgi:NIMA-interacting peptidyl-prolyl cis-trans isomerase 1